jgi:putative spermidine/putrescine transport system ATP-binding protein
LVTQQPKLAVRGVGKRYGPVTALQPTSLTVSAGEFLTLLGPSGSGKTTLLMMIAGLTPASEGVVELDGWDITDLPAYRRNIGVIFQNYALFPHLTVFENVAFPLRMRRLSESEIARKVGRALDLVQLGNFGARLPRELSGGQQQRVAFARAIVFEPGLVLMDEPLGALDKKLRDELKLEIRKLHRDLGTTVVYVTHDQEEAMLLSNRICLMNNARVEQIDAPMALYQRPVSRFAATFLGESNILSGVRVEGGVRIGERLLTTRHLDRLPQNGACDLLIRPERVMIGASDHAQNRFDALVRSSLDLGATRRLTLDLADGLRLDAITLGGGPAPQEGDRLSVAVHPDDVVPLAGEA